MVVSGKAQGDEGYKLKETREEKEEIYTTEQPSMLSLSLKQVSSYLMTIFILFACINHYNGVEIKHGMAFTI